MTKVFCIGNGESRKDFDLNKLKPYGKIYGCNALYRSFTPDVLVAVDGGIIHEIYHSGYSFNNECWFRDWKKISKKEYKKYYMGGDLTDEELNLIKKYFTNFTENNIENSIFFVIHGTNLNNKLSIIKRYIKESNLHNHMKIELNTRGIHISWTKKDKAHDLNEIFPNREFGWSAGPTSAYIALKQNNPKEIYLIGHDITSNTNKINNLYKDTKYYANSNLSKIKGLNWISQWKKLFNLFPNTIFYKVNNSLDEINDIDKKIKQWQNTPNLIYTTYEQSFSNW
jgi:hypothetical protein